MLIGGKELVVLDIQGWVWAAFDWQHLDFLIDVEKFVYRGLPMITQVLTDAVQETSNNKPQETIDNLIITILK